MGSMLAELEGAGSSEAKAQLQSAVLKGLQVRKNSAQSALCYLVRGLEVECSLGAGCCAQGTAGEKCKGRL